MKKLLLSLLALATLTPAFAQKFKGLALTPPMGWNSWNNFEDKIHESLVRQTADAMAANGMRDAGYVYIVIDDTWSLKQRDANGNLVPDPVKFPSGMKALGDYLHARGFKFGIYSDAGPVTCAGYPGSWGHEFQDARLFASWGVDYLKYDWCNHGTADPKDAYMRIRDGLYAAGRPVVLSICEWGENKPWEWGAEIGHLWRTTWDIYDSYNGTSLGSSGWKRTLDSQYNNIRTNGDNGINKFAGPDGWNDPDMLEVGNPGLTYAESRAHFALWCMVAAPLIAGNDVRAQKPEITALLTHKGALAIDQDPLGKQGYRALSEPEKNIEVWIKELSNGELAACVLNTGAATADLTVEWGRFWTVTGQYAITDVWTGKEAGDTRQPSVFHLESHDVALLRLKPLKP
ncbi:MAG: glycoside hydrolase family 27 protein [Opitutae bacterium]|nr:glycoside hydrolase family 27 protein [Opitutae bacterium]